MSGTMCNLVPPLVPVERLEPMQMPVIDFGKLHQTSKSRSLVIREIATACRDVGCFQVINHGIRKSVMKGALEAASEFFESSPKSKAKFISSDITRPVRYDCSNDGLSKSRSLLKHYAHPLDEWIHFWPQEPPSYREKMGKYAVEIRRVALDILDAIFQSLGLHQAYIREKLEQGMQFLAVNSYPQSTKPGVTVGLAPHSDYGFITLILPSCPGLEVMEHHTKSWKTVLQPSDALHVHVGDHLEVLSNGIFRTLVHRAVLNGETSRVSVASIHGFPMDEKVKSAGELLDEEHPRLYRESSFKDFLDFLLSRRNNNESYIESLRISTI
ncbi:hypothetical protein LUZ61_019724 [Rhynchospora tenuis]|uniref:Fe2OG dioxygenase domain-containing protein n=1 Tax=Rhynchospora tenuis TaxID=198213 RepID=A0AAD5ZBX6_9POAL|nr:hypothetical protein LUZ61_019724 [Rhynchospora tenuis]